jgi:hypothetical protein
MKNFRTLIPALLILFAVTACSSGPNMEDGLWEMTSQMEMEGMPNMPPMSYRECLSRDNMVPTQKQRNQDCEQIEQDISGDTITWRMRCTSNGVTSDINGSSTYSGDTMKGTMQMTTQGMQMTNHVTGKRVGSCK